MRSDDLQTHTPFSMDPATLKDVERFGTGRFRFWTQITREYNPVPRTFYGVNYIYQNSTKNVWHR